MTLDNNYKQIEDSIKKAISEHDPRLDSFLFNGGTVVALAATIVATSVTWPNDLSWLSRVLTGLAAFMIGVERALNFGERWRYHRRLRDGYLSIYNRYSLAVLLPRAQREAALTKVIEDLDLLRGSEGDIPKGTLPSG